VGKLPFRPQVALAGIHVMEGILSGVNVKGGSSAELAASNKTLVITGADRKSKRFQARQAVK
jgi:hypothetical protein